MAYAASGMAASTLGLSNLASRASISPSCGAYLRRVPFSVNCLVTSVLSESVAGQLLVCTVVHGGHAALALTSLQLHNKRLPRDSIIDY
uniref:Uncharacterized protein n=1 Tax=Nymphaea colorata TaxID=210225 RepID=A0A5K0ZFA2_9MAGN